MWQWHWLMRLITSASKWRHQVPGCHGFPRLTAVSYSTTLSGEIWTILSVNNMQFSFIHCSIVWPRVAVSSSMAQVSNNSNINIYVVYSKQCVIIIKFLAATAPHSGDWLLALLISSCGLRLDDEAVRVAVGIRLDLNLCEPHTCRCGAMVDARGLHSCVC